MDNYGQGEVQIELAGTIWGLYDKTSTSYILQYEEGMLDVSDFQNLLQLLLEQIKACFGNNIELKATGMLNPQEPIEKYG